MVCWRFVPPKHLEVPRFCGCVGLKKQDLINMTMIYSDLNSLSPSQYPVVLEKGHPNPYFWDFFKIIFK